MEASITYGRHVPTAQALEWVQESAAKRGRMDFGGYCCWWQQLTQPHLCGSPVPVGFPDDLEIWADKREKGEAVLVLGQEGADVSESGGGKAGARKKKRGRPPKRGDTDPAADKRTYDAFKASCLTYEQFARSDKKRENEVRLAIDRHRKRLATRKHRRKNPL